MKAYPRIEPNVYFMIQLFFEERRQAREFSQQVMALISKPNLTKDDIFQVALLADRFDTQHPLPRARERNQADAKAA